MLNGFLNHGSVIVHDLLLGTSTRVHTVSFPARRARSRRSAGHTTVSSCSQFLVIRHFLRRQLLQWWYLRQQRVRVRVMIGFLVRGRVRIKIMFRVRVRVTFGVTYNVGIYHRSNCRRCMQMSYIPILTFSWKLSTPLVAPSTVS